MRSLGVYIHIPFCRSKCSYCDFVSHCGSGEEQERYTAALCAHIKADASKFADYTVDTVYIGGGTPSCLRSGLLAKATDALRQNYSCEIKEFTCECNPDSFDDEKASELKDIGVNRISFGVQTLNDGILKKIGRRHDSNCAQKAVRLATQYGFRTSIDAMLGLEGQREEDVKDIIDFAHAEGVGHVSAYMLKVEQGTPLFRQVKDGLVLPDDDACADFYDFACRSLSQYGYHRYETSNFCKSGEECLHNLKYWTMQDYAAFGVSAHGKVENVRYFYTSDTDSYINMAQSGKFAASTEEILSRQDEIYEYVMLGLRLEKGADLCYAQDKYGCDLTKVYATGLAEAGRYVEIKDGRLRIKSEYALVANSIINMITQ